jgi:hypothetical protein
MFEGAISGGRELLIVWPEKILSRANRESALIIAENGKSLLTGDCYFRIMAYVLKN